MTNDEVVESTTSEEFDAVASGRSKTKGDPGRKMETRQRQRQEIWRDEAKRPVRSKPHLRRRDGKDRVPRIPITAPLAWRPPEGRTRSRMICHMRQR